MSAAGWLRRLAPSGIRARLILAVALVNFVLLALFATDLVDRQRAFLTERGRVYAASLASTLASNSSSWILANDVVGLQELVQSVSTRPSLRYAMVVNREGRVLAHTDVTRVGQYLRDEASLALLRAEPGPRIVHQSGSIVDVAAPVRTSTGAHVGWARVGEDQSDVARNLEAVSFNGRLYMVLAGLFGAGVAAFLGFRLTSRLSRLVAVSRQVRDGLSEERVEISGDDEISLMGRRFNEMLDALQSREEERHRLEAELLQSQKLESIGRLAGGVAHDFNNILVVILATADALQQDLEEGRPHRPEDIEELRTAGLRAKELTGQLLAFARKQVVAPVALDLDEAVRRADRLLRRVLGEDVELVLRLQPELWPVTCDPGQVQQVLMNLAMNARDAMPKGGRLTLSTANLEARDLDEAGWIGAWPTAGQLVGLRVEDTGTGIAPEMRSRLFEPFATSKPTGKGVGLGLATVHGILHQSGGTIRFRTEMGRGTTFELLWPRASGRPSAAVATPTSPVAPVPAPAVAVPRPTERILLVEDEELVRKAALRTLQAAGYQVVAASGGAEALATLAQGGPLPQLLLTDVVMPGMNGRVVAESVKRLHPEVRVLFMSGYAQDIVGHEGVVDPGLDLIEKPFTGPELLARVRAALGA